MSDEVKKTIRKSKLGNLLYFMKNDSLYKYLIFETLSSIVWVKSAY